jgi:hypothetical protein
MGVVPSRESQTFVLVISISLSLDFGLIIKPPKINQNGK